MKELDLRGDVRQVIGGNLDFLVTRRIDMTAIQPIAINSSVEVTITAPYITLNGFVSINP